MSFSYLHERTYVNILGPMGETATISAELVFADPISDIAVLSSPDGQELWDEHEAYEAWIERSQVLEFGTIGDTARVWLQHLDGQWMRCDARREKPGSGSRARQNS